MSWFGQSLTQIGGQISNFTKEVLTEGTEEVSDHVTELRVAKEKIFELENQCSGFKLEIERLKNVNGELEEKAESSELQINAISKEYRALLETKQEEIKSLKQKQNEMLESQQKVLMSSMGVTDVSPGSPSHTTRSNHHSNEAKQGYHGDEMDFGDVISSQHEINHLSNEVQRLTSEAAHWKQVAKNLSEKNENSKNLLGSDEELHNLPEEIRNLKKQLHDEVDLHHQEVTALQDSQLQKLTILKKKHRAEIVDYEDRIQDIQQKSETLLDNSLPIGSEQLTDLRQQNKALRDQISKTEDSLNQLTSELYQVKDSEREHERKVQLLSRQLEKLQSDKQKLNQENERVKDDINKTNDIIKTRDSELEELQKQQDDSSQLKILLEETKKQLQNVEEENKKLQETFNSVPVPDVVDDNQDLTQKVTDLEAKVFELENSVEFMSREKTKLDNEVLNLNAQLQHVLDEKSQKRSDSNSTLEVVYGEENQLIHDSELVTSTPLVIDRKQSTAPSVVSVDFEYDNESVGSSSLMGITNRSKQLDDQVKSFQGQIERYEHEIDHFENVRSDWKVEKETLENVLSQLRDKLKDKEQMLTTLQETKGPSLAQKRSSSNHENSSSRRKSSTHTSKKKIVAPVLPFESSELESLDPDSERHENEAVAFDMAESEASDSTEVDIEEWNRQIDMLTQANADLEHERDVLLSQKEDLEKRVEELQLELDQLQSNTSQQESFSQDVSQADIDNEIAKMRETLNAKEANLQELESERNSLMESMEELDTQHEQAMQQIIITRDSLVNNNNDLKNKALMLEGKLNESFQKVDALLKEKSDLFQRIESLEIEQSKAEGLLDEIDLLKSQLNESKEQIEGLSAERDGLTSEISNFSLSFSEKQQIADLEELLSQSDTSMKDLTKEKSKHIEEIGSLQKKLENGAQALNDLHMDKRDMEATIGSLKNAISDLKDKQKDLKAEKIDLEKTCNDLKSQLTGAQEELNSFYQQSQNQSRNNEIQDQLETEISDLNKKLRTSSQTCEKYQFEIGVVRKTVQDLEIKVESLEAEKDDMVKRLDTNESELYNQKEELNERYREYTEDLEMQIDALKSEKQTLERELNQAEHRLRDQAKHYETYVQDMSTSRSMDGNDLQVEHEKMLKTSHEKDLQIEELTEQLEEQKSELEDAKEMLQSAIEGQKPLADLIDEKENEISSLKADNQTLSMQYEEHTRIIGEQKEMLESLKDSDQQLKIIREDNKKLLFEVDNLRQQLDTGRVDSKTLDVITDLESEITTLSNKLTDALDKTDKLRTVIKEHEDNISNMNNKTIQHISLIQQHEEKMSRQTSEITNLKQEISEKNSNIASLSENIEKLNVQLNNLPLAAESEVFQQHDSCLQTSKTETENMLNGDVTNEPEMYTEHDKMHNTALNAQVNKLQKLMQQKDDVISELQSNNSSLLKMLEDRSHAIHGNKTLVELHKCENQVKSLQVEREQIMTILNEKSRECSSLKGEVHRLMNAISVEKASLTKLQEEKISSQNATLEPIDNSQMDQMSKEAIKNLSRMIRDKDQEIDALQQKNQTLLMVLQDSSQDSKQISNGESGQIQSLLQERDNLVKQLQAYVADREQIVAALNQKHQESLTYHSEVQVLTQQNTNQSGKIDRIQSEYDKIVKQFEDKQQLLVKAQNDLANYKQKFSEMETRYNDLASHGKPVVGVPLGDNVVEMKLYREKCDEIQRLNDSLENHLKKVKERQDEIQDKDKAIADIRGSVIKQEDVIASKDAENNALKKQIDKLNFNQQGQLTELEDLKRDNDGLLQNLTEQQTQNEMSKESMNRLTLSLKDKEFEIKALREKTDTLTNLIHEKGERGDNTGDINRVLAESESMQMQAQTFQKERDQVMLALKQRQTDNDSLQNDVLLLKEKEGKLQKELGRLRGHLIEIEDGYTQEALQSEEREKELRTRLAIAEESLHNSSQAVESASYQATQHVESLQEQLHTIASQRDQAILQLSTTQEQLHQYASSLQNLQAVLEQFQLEKTNDFEKYQDEMARSAAECLDLKSQLADLQNQLVEASDALEAAHRLHEQLDRKEDAIQALKMEVEQRENALKTAEDRMRHQLEANEGKVDKMIIKSLFVGYFSTPHDKRSEVIKLIGKVLDFNHDEMQKVGVESRPSSRGSWLQIPSILRRSPAAPQTPTTPRSPKIPGFDKSFSELFVKFLETESTPQAKVKLPVDQMVKEEQDKHSQQPAFNPFSAPRHVALPLQLGETKSMPNFNMNIGTSKDTHPLMNPNMSLPDSLPVFAPIPSGTPSNQTLGGAASGSGRSTPSTAGNILKDVLQQ